MKKFLSVSNYVILLVALILVGAAVSASAQSKRNDQTLDFKSNDGKVRIVTEQWSNDAEGGGFKNCRIKFTLYNLTEKDIPRWGIEFKGSKDPKGEKYDSYSESNKGRLMYYKDKPGADATYQDLCYVKKDSIKITY